MYIHKFMATVPACKSRSWTVFYLFVRYYEKRLVCIFFYITLLQNHYRITIPQILQMRHREVKFSRFHNYRVVKPTLQL